MRTFFATRYDCTRDGNTHWVTDEDFRYRRMGLVGALCGHIVEMAPMENPPGPPCLACALLYDSRANADRGPRELVAVEALTAQKSTFLDRLLRRTAA